MMITQEMNEKIEKEMAALDKNCLLRPGMAYTDFVTDYTGLLAQAVTDLVILEAAGFEGSKMPLYEAYLEKLLLEHGERVAEEGDVTPNQTAFAEGMPKARKDRKRLMAMGRFVVKRSGSPEAKRVYDLVRKGSGDVDTLDDNVAMVALARRYKDLVAKVRPGGRPVTEEELARIETEASALLKLKGASSNDASAPSAQVNRKGRIVSLCVAASRDIRLMAEMAYYDDLDTYNRFYAAGGKPPSPPTPAAPPSDKA